MVEVRDVEIPQDMQRAMARQAEAERERRAKVISAAGEFEASAKLTEAAAVISETRSRSVALPADAARDSRAEFSTTIFPVPIDLIRPFVQPPKDGPA